MCTCIYQQHAVHGRWNPSSLYMHACMVMLSIVPKRMTVHACIAICNYMLTLISIATLYTKIMFDVRILLFLLVCSINSEGTRDLRDNGFSSFNNKHVEFQHINYINFVKWTDEGTLLKNGYCATFKDSDRFFTARCPYFSIGDHTASRDDPSFIVLPKNSSCRAR